MLHTGTRERRDAQYIQYTEVKKEIFPQGNRVWVEHQWELLSIINW